MATKTVSKLDRAVKLLSAEPFMSVEDFTKKLKIKKPYAYILRSKARALIPKASIEEAANEKAPTTFIVPPPPDLPPIQIQSTFIPAFLRENLPQEQVNHPPHYKVGGIETIDFIEAKGLDYNLGNVVKYVTRAEYKGNKLQDLEKARWYLDRAISNHVDGRELV